MSKKKPLVGFDRYVEKQWMDQAAKLVGDGKPLAEINVLLDEYLLTSIDGETSRRKTKNILTATWVKSSGVDEVFKAEAVELFRSANNAERLAIHYGMGIATYPYFLSLSKILGRLFKLQDEVTNSEFNRRVIESVGDRESIKRAAARYLQSLIQWEVLVSTGKSSVKPGNKIQLKNSALITWLYSSVLFSSEKDRLSMDEIVSDPAWFPFEIAPGCFKLAESQLVEVVHQGIGSTLISLSASAGSDT
ncbi:MAG: hypothetical protein GKR95_03695 [Gammaproteobacteria bacterium]|nr:hypothetical protein [Gammaproteobacteria bacterium]